MPRDEHQTRIELINPALNLRGWGDSLIREEKTPGGTDIINGRPRKRSGRTDYLLCVLVVKGKSPMPLAILEAKAEDKLPSLGIQQAKDYMKKFNVPFIFSTNGKLFAEYGEDTGQIKDAMSLSDFPTPEDLKLRYEKSNGFKLDSDAAKLNGDWIKEMQSAALILEAHHSTHIEGTQLTLSDAQKILAGKHVEGVRPDDRQELMNYKDAMDFVSEYLDIRSEITEDIIKGIHRILVKDVRGGSLEPGCYRKFMEWLNKEKDVSPVLMAGVAQHRFVDIHPFLDGNGRTARVLCTLILYQKGYDFKRLFSLSEFYDKNRREYYDSIQSVRETGMDMTVWLEYFVRGLKNQMLEVRSKGEVAIRKEIMIEKAIRAELNDRQKKALYYLMDNPAISRSEYVKLCKVSIRSANYDLVQMEKLGFIGKSGVGRAIKYSILQGR